LEICCTLLNGTLPTPEMLSVRPVVELGLEPEDELDDELDDDEVDEPVEPEPPMLTLSTVPFT
jgi:hypothetical protein